MIRKIENSEIRVDITVDFRRNQYIPKSSANLTGPIRITLDEIFNTSDPISAFTETIKNTISRGVYGSPILQARALRWFPLRLMRWVGKIGAKQALRKNRYDISGVLSNMGRLNMDVFSTKSFIPRTGYFIPPGGPGVPLFLASSGGTNTIELCASMPKVLASKGRLENLLGSLADTFRGDV